MGFDLELVEKVSDTLVTGDSGDWAVLSAIDPASNGYDPVVGHSSQAGDPDFNDTWKNQSLGGYNGAAYDGPSFTTGQQGPFAYGGVDGLPSPNTVLPTPNSGTRRTAYFVKEIDGGTNGFDKATFTILADDGAFIYLNGNLVGVTGNLPNDATQDSWDTLTSGAGSETAIQTITATGTGVIQPGSNLLAVSLHQHSTTSSDLGFSLELVGAQVGAPVVERGPYLQSGSHDRMTLRWRTSDAANSVVHFGDSPTNLTQTITVEDSVTDHIVTLTGLDPATQYYYQIESTNGSGTVTAGGQSDFYFKTYPTPGAQVPTRLWVIGDSGTRTSNQANVYNAYRNRTGAGHTDAWLMLGDNAYNSGTDSEFQGALFDAYPELLRNTTMWSCIGNHETYTSGGDPYLDIHSFPTAGECGGVPSGNEYYYSYDHGNIHFVCLDSATSNVSDTPGSGGMIDWLEADLQATDKDWIIAYFHHGPYTKGSHNSDTEGPHISVRNYITPLLEDYGVDLVLSGHSHTYERSMLVNGHHSDMSTADSRSGTFDYNLHVIDNGNGSQTGSIDGNGNFIADGGDGAYRKELGSTQSGTIYSVCGASGKLSGWANGSTATVNPAPHPVFVVNLRTLGSMIINVDGNTMSAQYLDDNNVVRDDFTIVKPPNGSVQTASVSQFDSVGVAITTVTANGSGTLAYSIIEGNEAGKFEIDGETGVIRSLALFDYQTDKIYNLTIGVTDDGVPVSPVLVTVNVTLDPPATNSQPVLNDAAFAIDESSGVSSTVGVVAGTDPDGDDILTYSIVAGNTGSAFAINASTGEITTATTLDHETTPAYSLTVAVMDDGTPQESDTANIAINIGDVNEAPSLADRIGEEGREGVAYLGTMVGTDPDTGDTLTYSILSGPAWLGIDNDGTLSGTPAVGDAGTHTWLIRITDSGDLTADANLEITITANTPPVLNDAVLLVPENSSVATVVGFIAATDSNSGDTLSYAITGGNDAGRFALNSATGELTTTTILDYETTPEYVLTISVIDDGIPQESDTANITIQVGNINEAPTLANSTGAEGEEAVAYTGSIAGTGSDPDTDDTLSYSKVSGPAWLSVANDGTLSGTPAIGDVGVNSWAIRVTDSGGLSAEASLDIIIIGNSPPIASDAVFSAPEDSSVGTVAGIVVATDPDPDDLLSYAITGGNAAGAFAINASTGEITTATTLDFETTPSFALTVTVTDDGTPSLSGTATMTIDVLDINEPPSLENMTGGAGEVGQPYSGSIAGSGNDPDANDTLTYSKGSGPTWLAIEADGTLSGTPGSVDVGDNLWTISVTDSGGLPADATLTISVTAAPSGPISVSASGESTAKGTSNGALASTTNSDNSYEILTEEISGGRNKRSELDHQWTFSNVPEGSAVSLRVEAHHTTNSEGDDFVFSYSADGSTYTNVLTVTKTSDDNVEQTAVLPSSLSGTIYIRVTDTDNSRRNDIADSLYIDLLSIDVVPLTGPPLAVSDPSPAHGSEGIGLDPTLTWTAGAGAVDYEIFFGTSAPGTSQGSQTGTTFQPATLLPQTRYYWRIGSTNSNGTTLGPVWDFTTGSGASSTLFSDDFEDGNLDGWATTGSISANSSAANTGVYGAKIRNSGEMTITVDTTGLTMIQLAYDRVTSSFDSGENLVIEWSANGTNWTTIESTNATSWGQFDQALPSTGGLPALRIRFRSNANRNNENAYIDNVILSGS